MKRKVSFFPGLMMLLLSLLLSSSAVIAQKSIRGKVTDGTNGQALPAVSVVVQGTTVGTATGVDGTYTIDVPAGATNLVFSFIGYTTQTVNIGGQSVIDVILREDVTLLNEVVVIGYGEQSRSKMTTSVSKLDTKVLENVAISNAGAALQGTVSGLRVINTSGQPGSSPSILLRGGASINNPGAPLVVIDGIVRSLSDFNPADIESMQVLKDAASTAIYGSRANNGVILITTKKGKYGTSDITYKVKTGFNLRREGYGYLDARDYIYYNRMGVRNLNVGRVQTGATPYNPNTNNGYGLGLSALLQQMFSIKAVNSTTKPDFQKYINEGWQFMEDPFTDVSDTILFRDFSGQVADAAFTQRPFTQDHHLSFTGGNEAGKFAASLGYYDEDGLIIGTKYKRYSATLNGSYKIKKNFEVNGALTFSASQQPTLWTSEANLFYRTMSLWPTYNPYDADGNPTAGNGPSDGNPIYWLNRYVFKDDTRRTTFSFGADWEIVKSLSLKAQTNFYYYDYLYQSFNKASQRQTATTPDVTRQSYAYDAKSLQQQHTVTLDYSKSVSNHNFTILAGGELFDYSEFAFTATGQKAPTDDIYTLNAATERTVTSSATSAYRILSGFGRLTYDYSDRYLFTAVARYDGISRLAEGNRWGFFPGISAGWNLHKEDFFLNSGLSSVVTTLKPRLSYGFNGNVAGLGNYEVQGVYGIQTAYSGYQGFLNTGIVNKALQWEKSRSFEAGVDIGLLNNRVMILAGYYRRITSDLLTDLALPEYTGFTSLRTNLGTFQNSGFEAEVVANVLTLENGLKWDLGFNTSINSNKILKLPENGNDRNRQGGIQIFDPESGQVIWVGGYQEGGTLGEIYAYQQERILRDWNDVNAVAANRYDKIAELYGPALWAGLANKTGKLPIEPGDVLWADLDKNDTIDFRDRVKVGSTIPKVVGGFSSNLSYRGITLSARFDYALGHTIYNDVAARTLGQYQGTFNIIDWVKRSWTPENTETDIPKFYYADQLAKKNYTRENNANANLNGNNSLLYEKGDYLALRELTLSYNLPSDLVNKAKLSAVSVYVTGQNIAYFTKYTGTAPEIGGVDSGRYPLPKSYIMGLQVSF